MSNPLSKWYSSKRGKDTVNAVLLGALVISLMANLAGPGGFGDWLSGTAVGGGRYTCLPTCAEDDARFLALTDDFGGTRLEAWITVEGGGAFELGFFDGDSGRDGAGNLNVGEGNWDDTQAEVTYTLYADPARDGTGATVVGTWHGNGDGMPNNAWHDVTIDQAEAAQAADGRHAYRLVAELASGTGGTGTSAFKLRSTGQLTAGVSGERGIGLGLVGMMGARNDVKIIYPEFNGGDWTNLGPSTYDGTWTFYFEVPPDTETLRIWDGDFDRGTYANEAQDTDDPNTDGIPPWADPDRTKPEGEGGSGDPPDDYNWNLLLRQPPVWYELVGPEISGGRATFRNDEPSGHDEWEAFVVSTNPEVAADIQTTAIPAGTYEFRIGGLDLYNTIRLHLDFELSAHAPGESDPGPTPTPEPLELRTCRGNPADILYVIDTSSSMGQLYRGAGSKLSAAQEAVLLLNEWVASLGNGSRVALVTFSGPEEGFGTPPIYPPDVELVSRFTDDIRTVNTRLLGLSARGTKPTAAGLTAVADLLAGTVAPGHRPVMILISDGVPVVDFDRYRFDPLQVEKVAVYAPDGTVLPADAVRANGAVSDLYGQAAGEPLADTLVALERLVAAMPELPIYTLAVQTGSSSAAGNEILRAIAEAGGGERFAVSSASALLTALQEVYAEETCDYDDVEPVVATPMAVGPETCASYTLLSQTGDRRRVQLEIENGSAVDAVTLGLHAESWPAEWGSLERVKVLGGDWVDVNATAPIDIEARGIELRAGRRDQVVLQFQNDANPDVTALVGYLEMTTGCRVGFGTR